MLCGIYKTEKRAADDLIMALQRNNLLYNLCGSICAHLCCHEQFVCARQRITPKSNFVQQRLCICGEKGFYKSFRCTKLSFVALQSYIVERYESQRSLLGEEIQKSCDSIILFGRQHTFSDYLCATLYYLGHHLYPAFDVLSDLFGICASRLNSTIHIMLKLIRFTMTAEYLPFLSKEDALSNHIKGNDGRFALFSNAIGAIDGTFIPYRGIGNWVSGQNRCYKGFFATNVLLICDFHMRIRFALLGSEGSLSDNATMRCSKLSSLWERTFGVNSSYYLLGDAGFSMSNFVLPPFRGARYHLVEWLRGKMKPMTPEELYNLRQSSLRTIIERTIGLLKGKYPILKYGFVAKFTNMKNVSAT